MLLLKDISHWNDGVSTERLHSLRGVGALLGGGCTHGRELRRTDGSEEGTVLVGDLVSGATGSLPDDFFVGPESWVYFLATTPEQGREIWRANGELGSAQLVADVVPGPEGSEPTLLATAGGHVFFAARGPDTGRELWVTDGTPAGTHIVRDFCPGACDGLDSNFFAGADGVQALGDGIVFEATTSTARNPDLWFSDGTGAGTVSLIAGSDVFFEMQRLSGPFARVGDLVVFAHIGAGTGAEPWVTDGSPGGTRILADLCEGPCSSMYLAPYTWMSTALSGVLFPAETESEGREVWWTDGTAEGLVRLTDYPHYLPSFFRPVVSGERAFVTLFDFFQNDRRIYELDGTPEGTQEIALPGACGGGLPTNVTPFQDGVLFLRGDELCRVFEGATSATEVVRLPGDSGGEIADAGSGAFIVSQYFDGDTLWWTDGTPDGTSEVPPYCGIGSCSHGWLIVDRQRAFLAFMNAQGGPEPYVAFRAAALEIVAPVRWRSPRPARRPRSRSRSMRRRRGCHRAGRRRRRDRGRSLAS